MEDETFWRPATATWGTRLACPSAEGDADGHARRVPHVSCLILGREEYTIHSTLPLGGKADGDRHRRIVWRRRRPDFAVGADAFTHHRQALPPPQDSSQSQAETG